jgi:hypothetical protein
LFDPLTSLAFSVYSGKGVYALLLGSGVSRAAEIPTGWEVTLDLVRKIATVEGEDCDPDPESWYRKRFGTGPEYSALLENLAITPSERTNMLASYFEATPEERELGKKTPTVAHKAIARLASGGYFRVIVTTNFDRLMEQALEAEGVNPAVISTGDMAQGAMPLTHAQCTVIKVHGDYRDTRLRNTTKELAAYPAEINSILDRVFDEYGLIVCGWSATWDRALCEAIRRSPNRRFSAFWGLRSAPSTEAADLIKFRQAFTLEIESADSLFSTVEQKVESLEMFNRPHPLSTPIAVASLKKFLTEDRFRVDLRELVHNEVEREIKALAPLPAQYRIQRGVYDEGQYIARLELYESSMEMLIPLIAHGCFYGSDSQAVIWRDAIIRIASLSKPQGGHQDLVRLQGYSACMLLYAGGIVATAAQKYGTLRILLREAKTPASMSFQHLEKELIFQVAPADVLDKGTLNALKGQRAWTPACDRVHDVLRGPLRPLVPDDDDFDDLFDRFEYLFALVRFDITSSKQGPETIWAPTPVGRFGWRGRDYGRRGSHVSEALEIESDTEKEAWGPIRSGLFASSMRFKEVNDSYRTNVLAKIQNY